MLPSIARHLCDSATGPSGSSLCAPTHPDPWPYMTAAAKLWCSGQDAMPLAPPGSPSSACVQILQQQPLHKPGTPQCRKLLPLGR